jgi:hypothetical protein
MRKIALFVAFLILFALASTAYAHPPSDIKITFDPNTKTVTAVIMHDVSNPLNHYIKKVDVGLNGKEIIEQSISRQDNNDSQTVNYFIPDIKDGDKIFVEGHCSISGALKKEIVVEM